MKQIDIKSSKKTLTHIYINSTTVNSGYNDIQGTLEKTSLYPNIVITDSKILTSELCIYPNIWTVISDQPLPIHLFSS